MSSITSGLGGLPSTDTSPRTVFENSEISPERPTQLVSFYVPLSKRTLLCAYAWNLDAMLLFRIMQGLGGGGMVPVAQSILADAFPPEKRGQGFALFGVAVVVAPVVGPTLGGWLSDNYSWRWAFLINAPVGLITMGLIALVL